MMGVPLVSIQGRSGYGQDFESEFCEWFTESDLSLRVPESKSFRRAQHFPGCTDGDAFVRLAIHNGESRLVIDLPGIPAIPFDDAPAIARRALIPWVERFASQLRRIRTNSER
jgi:hypothetical protein